MTVTRACGHFLAWLAVIGIGGCGPSESKRKKPKTDTVADTALAPSPSPTANETSTSGTNLTLLQNPDGTVALAKVSSGIDAQSLTIPVTPAASGAPDVVGAFRFHCAPSHLAYDDPVMMPGKPGQFHHLHQFFGNVAANANSTYESLRRTGDSTCINALNRSAYWMPAMLGKNTVGGDVVIVPQNINIYYKRQPASSNELTDRGLKGMNLPRGLRYVFGFPDVEPRFKCVNEANWSNVTEWTTMDGALAGCQVGHNLYVTVASPGCWDGKNLDSSDHRSHMAHTFSDGRCPDTHRYFLPSFTIQANYKITATDVPSSWTFSSDSHLNPGGPRGSSFHADWFGAWEDDILDRWQANCIDKLLSCVSGDLGDGTMLKPTAKYEELMRQAPQRLPVPLRPTA